MADTREIPQEPRRDDAFLVDDVRVCPLKHNTPMGCGWVVKADPRFSTVHPGGVVRCVCSPPPELWRRGR